MAVWLPHENPITKASLPRQAHGLTLKTSQRSYRAIPGWPTLPGCPWPALDPSANLMCRRRTNVQQLTCKIDSSNSFYYLFFSFIIFELIFYYLWAKTPCFEGESPGGKSAKKCQKVPKSVKNYETILPFSCCPLVFPRMWADFDLKSAFSGPNRVHIKLIWECPNDPWP